MPESSTQGHLLYSNNFRAISILAPSDIFMVLSASQYGHTDYLSVQILLKNTVLYILSDEHEYCRIGENLYFHSNFIIPWK